MTIGQNFALGPFLSDEQTALTQRDRHRAGLVGHAGAGRQQAKQDFLLCGRHTFCKTVFQVEWKSIRTSGDVFQELLSWWR